MTTTDSQTSAFLRFERSLHQLAADVLDLAETEADALGKASIARTRPLLARRFSTPAHVALRLSEIELEDVCITAQLALEVVARLQGFPLPLEVPALLQIIARSATAPSATATTRAPDSGASPFN